MNRFLTIFFLSIPIILSAQKVIKPDIQYVTITDTVLINVVKNYIEEEEKIDTLFAKGKGYINVNFSYGKKNGKEYIKYGDKFPTHDRIDTVFTYYLETSFMSAEGKENTLDDMYPSFYSFVNGRLICFSDWSDRYFGFSEDSKKKYRKMLEKYIEPVGSKSRSWLIIDRETRIHFLRSITSKRKYDSYVVVKIKR